ncbi:hypothetical protein BC834DRAFT_845463 [Gloeopeniophorella convolvens]|nr:hypothetical protein BC834DRAFT_845463 [Gloeopeniophorella convolvens]
MSILLGEHEHQQVMATLQRQLSHRGSQLSQEPHCLAGELSSVDQFLRRDLSGGDSMHAGSALAPIDEVDEPYGDDFVEATLQHVEAESGGQSGLRTEDLDLPLLNESSLSPINFDPAKLGFDLVDRLSGADTELPEAYEEGDHIEHIASSLTGLYMDYRRSVARLEVMPATALPPSSEIVPTESLKPDVSIYSDLPSSAEASTSAQLPASPEPAELVPPVEVHAQAAMSKTQHQLAIEEGKLWEKLANPDMADEGGSLAEATLASLRAKSDFMVQSYNRRTNPPTAATFAESRDILGAMGVPCIESQGAYEAEALASSIVLHGLADYVASEDTVRAPLHSPYISLTLLPQDVLVYGAPLLRNITSRDKPLLLLSATDVRAALTLDSTAFVDFALLLGTDFAPRIRNVGPHRALHFLHKHGRIEDILAAEPAYAPRVPRAAYLNAVRAARGVFAALPRPPDARLLVPGEYRADEVATILGMHRLQRFLEPAAVLDTLEGNYFDDNPAASVSASATTPPFT